MSTAIAGLPHARTAQGVATDISRRVIAMLWNSVEHHYLRPDDAGLAEIGFDAPLDCFVVAVLEGLEPV